MAIKFSQFSHLNELKHRRNLKEYKIFDLTLIG